MTLTRVHHTRWSQSLFCQAITPEFRSSSRSLSLSNTSENTVSIITLYSPSPVSQMSVRLLMPWHHLYMRRGGGSILAGLIQAGNNPLLSTLKNRNWSRYYNDNLSIIIKCRLETYLQHQWFSPQAQCCSRGSTYHKCWKTWSPLLWRYVVWVADI